MKRKVVSFGEKGSQRWLILENGNKVFCDEKIKDDLWEQWSSNQTAKKVWICNYLKHYVTNPLMKIEFTPLMELEEIVQNNPVGKIAELILQWHENESNHG